jgi:acyl carrier protein
MTTNPIVELIAREAKRPTTDITLDTNLSDLGIDSLKAIVILSELEDQLNVEIPNETMGSMRTVGNIVSKIDELRQIKKTA